MESELILTMPSQAAAEAAKVINESLRKGELIRLTDYCRTASRSRQHLHRLTTSGAVPSVRIGTVTYLAVKRNTNE